MIRWLREGLWWRWLTLRRMGFLLRSFRNGPTLARRYCYRRPCERAVCWDGSVFLHPADRGGLAETILEIWHDQVYTGRFYRPLPGDVVIDAGANIGLFCIWLAKCNPDCRVVAFEPFAENYQLLTANIQSARMASVQAFQAGLGGTTGSGRMADGGGRSLDHRLEPGQPGDPGSVPTYSFADALALAGSDRIALCKIDIEGAEYPLFEHATDANLARVDRYAIEYHEHICPGIAELIRARLEPTHGLTIHPSANTRYGMIYATIRNAVVPEFASTVAGRLQRTPTDAAS